MLYTGYIIQINPFYLLPVSVIGALRRSRTIARASSDQSRRRWGSLAEAPNRQLVAFLTVRRPCTDFPTRPSTCLPAYLPAYLPTCLLAYLPAYLSAYLPAYLPT
jgi:hypothetical protein